MPDAVELVLAPLADAEVDAIVREQVNPWPSGHELHRAWKPLDPRRWLLPTGQLPIDYLGFLRWSDGASWRNGSREFACFGCEHLRQYLLHYHFPEYMPGAIPFGLDGGGLFCVFDMRSDASHPVFAIGSGAIDWSDAVPLATDFMSFCRGRTKIGDDYYGGLKQRVMP